MKPSEASSTKGLALITQPSPVQAIINAFRKAPPMLFDVADDTHTLPVIAASPAMSALLLDDVNIDPMLRAPRSASPKSPDLSSLVASSSTSSASKRNAEDSTDADTPSKRIRLMTANLSQTTSGSFLVSKPKMTTLNRIAPPILQRAPFSAILEPNWSLICEMSKHEHLSHQDLAEGVKALTLNLRLAQLHVEAQDGIIESANAQLVIQNIYTDKLHHALFEKETKKVSKANRVVLNVGGTHLTDEEFIQEMEHRKQAREAGKEAKRIRKEQKVAKKAKKDASQAAWQEILIAHQSEVNTWKTLCDRLVQQGARKKDLPSKLR
ncbi:hypothetical protein EWM64_g2638 [Hericium alpestre]|uniref:Uncharacterized protein n=1 Tax=Hericium alpestre TaxID=135208 RepID=A0A4Z0A4N7_9AGAM|nr:hypothetical protein EWM64_g2638 [Hericium alpestre]